MRVPVRRFTLKLWQVCFAAVIVTAAFSQRTLAQINFQVPPIQLVDNDANQGSPTIIAFNGQVVMYYVNHSNNTIYVDFGFSGNPVSTGIAVDSAELTDVGATVLNGQVLISWVATDNQPSFAVSNNGVSFGPRVVPADSSLGIGNQGPDTAFVPALTSNGTTAYVATVGANQLVYMSYTTNGSSFSPLIANGVSVSAYQTTSRPSLTMYNGHPWVAFTDVSPRQAVIGDATGTNAPVVDTNVYWGNSHRNSNYAGISLLNYGGLLWAFGQDTASSQYLKYIDSNGGSTWSGASFQGPWFQMRWTPSLTALTVGPAIYAYLAYQDDANTNISYSHN